MSSVIILGDVHIGKGVTVGKTGIGTALNSRILDQINLLDWVLEQAIEHQASHIIVTGDIFEDPKPTSQLIGIFIDWLKKCLAYSIIVDVIAGNHDIYTSNNFYISPLDIIDKCDLENLTIHKNITTVFIDTTAFTLMPFRDRKSLNAESNSAGLSLIKDSLVYELAAIPLTYKKVVVGHFAIEGSIPIGDEIDDLTNELFCPINMFKGYDYVWMGHVHKPQVMSKSNPYIAHVGSMDTSNFIESNEKKVIILYDTDDATFSEIVLPTRPLQKIAITVPKDTKDTTQFVMDEITQNYSNLHRAIVKIEVSLSSPELVPIDRAKVEKFLQDKSVYHISGFSESKKATIVKKDKAEVIDTAIDTPAAIKKWAEKRFPEKTDEDKKNKLVEVGLALLTELKSEGKE